MNWQKLADDFKTHNALQDLSDAQVEGIVTILHAVIHADQKVTFTEEMELDHLLMELPWIEDKNAKIASFGQAAEEKLSQGSSSDALIAAASQSLEGEALRERVFTMAAVLGHADGSLDSAEMAVMKSLASALEIPSDRAHDLIQKAAH